MSQQNRTLLLPVTFDSSKTDLEGLSVGIDTLLTTAASTPGVLDDYGKVVIGDTEIAYVDGETREVVHRFLRTQPPLLLEYVEKLEKMLGLD